MSLSYGTLEFKTKFKSDYLNEDVLNLLDTTFTIPYSYQYNIFEVTKDYIARPDLISYDAYGDSMYADILCKLNGISNPFELNEGMTLIIPSPDDIIKFAWRPDSNEKETGYADGSVNNDYKKPFTTKNKQSKRKANEAIIGDSRFKINTADGIIIY